MWTLYAARAPGRVLGVAQAGTGSRAEPVLLDARVGTPDRAGVYSWTRDRDQNRGVPSSSTVGSTVSPDETEKRATARRRRTRAAAVQEAEHQERPDVAALLDRTGWASLTTKARKVLDDLASRHDGPSWAARRIREAPATPRPGDVLDLLIREDKAERERIAQEEAAYSQEKAERERIARASPLPGLILQAAGPPAPDPDVLERRRRSALAMLRDGLAGPAAERLRADYGITDEELRS